MQRREQVVHDEQEPCPYIEGQTARMPLRWQFRRLTGTELDDSLAAGDRRVGRMLYRTSCPVCTECRAIRVPVDTYQPTRSQRRVWRKNRDIHVETGPATFSEEKLALYNRHKLERGLARNESHMTRRGFEGWFVHSCARTVEMRYRVDGRLIGVGILDIGERDASSVYYFFDPDEGHRSLGVFSVMIEAAWLKSQGGRYHYLGLYVEECRHLVYKGNYYPHERLVGDQWIPFMTPSEDTGGG
jgi:leucyl-tRNA---protein transferase